MRLRFLQCLKDAEKRIAPHIGSNSVTNYCGANDPADVTATFLVRMGLSDGKGKVMIDIIIRVIILTIISLHACGFQVLKAVVAEWENRYLDLTDKTSATMSDIFENEEFTTTQVRVQ